MMFATAYYPKTRKHRPATDFTKTVRYVFLRRLLEWCAEKPGEGTPDITGFWLIIGGKSRISYKCFYELHYKKLRDDGYIMDYVDPATGARALIITPKSRGLG
jgi:hypothetical protein